jgi:hypothetical protein
MNDEIVLQRRNVLVRRLRLAPGEPMPWHRDPFHRVTVVLGADALAIEFRGGDEVQHVEVSPGLAGWDEPTDVFHRAVNVGEQAYDEITIFFLDHPDAAPQLHE